MTWYYVEVRKLDGRGKTDKSVSFSTLAGVRLQLHKELAVTSDCAPNYAPVPAITLAVAMARASEMYVGDTINLWEYSHTIKETDSAN